jgi:hypothetical protein
VQALLSSFGSSEVVVEFLTSGIVIAATAAVSRVVDDVLKQPSITAAHVMQ